MTTPTNTDELPSFRRLVDPADAAANRAAGYWGDVTLGHVIAGHAAAHPDRPAIIEGVRRLSWQGYDGAADELAAVLAGLGLPSGARVAVLLPDGIAVHVAFVACERAGLTVVGVGHRAGDREIQHLLTRTGASAIITEPVHADRPAGELVATMQAAVPALRRHVVVELVDVGSDGAGERVDPIVQVSIDGHPVLSPQVTAASRAALAVEAIGPDDLFMLNSTSGTTGLPKCVMHTQNRWMYFHQKAREFGALTGDDVVLGAVPAPFGFGLWTQHFTPTLLGAPVVVLPRFSAEAALEAIERERVTVLCCVSTQFVLMLKSPAFTTRDLSSLRVMFTGGEMVPYEHARAFEAQTGACILQFFGSNETGLLSGTRLDDPTEVRLRTAGRAVAEMQVRLFDGGVDVTDSGRGQPGCKGPATCLGYLDDPEGNAQLFTDDGWMLMADICTMDADANLAVVGRKSDLIIRGGKNISAAQVEDAVSSHPSVALCAAVAMPDPIFGERICVYVEPVDGSIVTLELVLEHLRAGAVSKELFPEHLIVVDRLPVSSGGKVAKGELRADLLRRLPL